MSNRKKAKPVLKKGGPWSRGSLDVHFGQKLKARRRTMMPKLSQTELADNLSVSFQQLQKCEQGRNRMSAAMIVQIAAVLKIDVQHFFKELPAGARNTKEIKTPVLTEMSLAAHGPRLIDAFLKLLALRPTPLNHLGLRKTVRPLARQ